MTFLFADPAELWLEIAPNLQVRAWQNSQMLLHPNSAWRAYLNQVCLDAFLPWLQAEYAPQARPLHSTAARPSIWDATNGTAIAMGEKRLVLIPTEAIDGDELRVPQEWADIPEWVGDYYLAVQVDPDERCLRVWGWTTHDRLKVRGTYDPRDRTYCLAAEDLSLDLNALWVAQQLCPDEVTRAEVKALPELPVAQAENLIQRLGNCAIASPRQEIPFPLWGALTSNDAWRQQWFQYRQGRSPVRLGQWFERLFETGWQSLDALFPNSKAFAPSFRRTSERGSDASVKRVKLLDLGSPEEATAVLLVELGEEPDGRTNVRIQLHPHGDWNYLPPKLQLTLLSETDKTLRSVESRSQDNFIQLPPFKCLPGFRFDVRVTLDERSITESFLV